MSEFRVGGLLITSKFDSGNLDRVERVPGPDEDASPPGPGQPPVPDVEVNVWTKRDAAGTAGENGNRTWFYFAVKGASAGKYIKVNVMNLNRQFRLFQQGMSPVYRVLPQKPNWERIREKMHYENVDEVDFMISFCYRFEFKNSTAEFAFCYPFSYTEYQNWMETLDKQFHECSSLPPIITAKENPDEIYYHRENAIKSLDGHRVDLMTISSYHGISSEREHFIPNLFPDHKPRPYRFRHKRVYFLSSRVHPGETPASFVFNGFLKFILRPDDPRAIQLRRIFVFKLIPLLNPDGVFRGHYRTDALGVNLNRVYLDPDLEVHSPIYASKALLTYHHVFNAVKLKGRGGSGDKENIKNTLSTSLIGGNCDQAAAPCACLADGDVSLCTRIDPEIESLSDSKFLLTIPSADSGVAFYVDLHGHASKRGCFIYGNHVDNLNDQVENVLYTKLISMNSAHFDFAGCNFTERNMYMKDKRDGASKEGAGRVAMYKQLGIVNSYTLECNYNTGRLTNCIAPASMDNGRASPPPSVGFPPRYTIAHYEDVGKACAVAALDMIQQNPWPRIAMSEYTTLHQCRLWVQRFVQGAYNGPGVPRKSTLRNAGPKPHVQ